MATTDPAAPNVEGKGKWHGSLKETINVPIDKAWAIAGNFCGVDKWFQMMDKCEKVEGEYQQPGCVRSLVSSAPDGSKSLAKEKLLSIDEKNYTYSYKLLENNFGLDDYVSNFKLQDLGNGTTAVDWAFSVNPCEGQTEKALEVFLTGMFRTGLTYLEDVVNSPSS